MCKMSIVEVDLFRTSWIPNYVVTVQDARSFLIISHGRQGVSERLDNSLDVRRSKYADQLLSQFAVEE